MHRDSLQPIRDNGLYDLLDIPASGLEVADGVRLVPTHGHTPGHLSVRLTGTVRNALISGDSLHHPVQLAYPDMGGVGDVDPAEARTTRHHLLTELAGTDDLLLGTNWHVENLRKSGNHMCRGRERIDLVPESYSGCSMVITKMRCSSVYG
ncbi:glyoxylase-like metal-dependent hydrolase (beta-lactamase superfamily II) [Streptomyces sp. V3I8]|uniref:MBL fold metallo-hydrolase n=1 Tax=Streptomyces sp. V3I8 TaxID=3042279 RepID=UPI00277D4655|nr:MBL fold metallo-hydrolase [Streptomyces sp. V3I8]MDQ1035385.1 glyoxylase-like metal-dependent hydrolase (beta-lactamase superfamily II) [Streptomyces sp. V3I8]